MAAALPWIALALTAYGTAESADASRKQEHAQADAMRYQAGVDANNKIIAEQNAEAAEQRGSRLAEIKQLDTAKQLGAVQAAVGGAGLTADSGLRLSDDTRMMGELDAATIRYNASREAYGFRTQGLSYSAQAQLDEMAAARAEQAGRLQSMGIIIAGGASVADKWARYTTSGTPGVDAPG